jgi:hypothetical protein
MSGKLTTVPLAQLVEDMEIYPRHAVDSTHVQAIFHALESGVELPPIVADKKSKRITDGWHRARAYRRFLGPEGSVGVQLIAYKDEAAMKLDAVARNATHGRRLDGIDKTRSVIMLRHSGFSDDEIAGALNVPEERITKLVVRVAKAPKGSAASVPGTNSITLKRSVSHLEGKSLTRSQADAHGMMPGTSFLLLAKQLCKAMEEGLIDPADKKLAEQLRRLHSLLEEKLVV